MTNDTQGKNNLYCYPEKSSLIISQNSSNRRVHRYLWKAEDNEVAIPVAIKFVADQNNRDGRSVKREVECHMFTQMKLAYLFQEELKLWQQQSSVYSFTRMNEWLKPKTIMDAWPSSELIAYHIDNHKPGNSILMTRKLSGPDFFDLIRCEHNHNYNNHNLSGHCHQQVNHDHLIKSNNKKIVKKAKPKSGINIFSDIKPLSCLKSSSSSLKYTDCEYYPPYYNYYKLRWAAITLKRLMQFHSINIRHNDLKPDNIVCDFHHDDNDNTVIDVKLIDLGTASFGFTTDFTGGTAWYESPEQKLIEFFGKKRKDMHSSKRVNIGLSSDIWGAGISLTEVLLGKRIVDASKTRKNIYPLEYLGCELNTIKPYNFALRSQILGKHTMNEDYYYDGGDLDSYPYWLQSPENWVLSSKQILFDINNKKASLAEIAAEWLFNSLVIPKASSRVKIDVAMNVIEQFAEEQYNRIRYSYTSFDGSLNSYLIPRKYNQI